MINIPVGFQLGGRNWTVRYVAPEHMRSRSKADADEHVLGMCITWDAEILIVQGLTAETTQHTFFHELCHAICETLGWDKMSQNEGKMDALGGMFLQFMKTQDF
jgi:hypothetical protein